MYSFFPPYSPPSPCPPPITLPQYGRADGLEPHLVASKTESSQCTRVILESSEIRRLTNPEYRCSCTQRGRNQGPDCLSN